MLSSPEMLVRRTRGGVLVLLAAVASVVALAGLVGCGGGKNETQGVVAVAGSQKCTSHNEVYRCIDSMSDARVSGTEVAKLRLTMTGLPEASAVAFDGPTTLTNAKGTWRGTCHGAAVITGPQNRNYARIEYRGHGAYEGLRYVEMIAGNDQTFEVTGRIEPVG